MVDQATVRERRAEILHSLGAQGSEVEELLRYNENCFDVERANAIAFPLRDEAFVSCWQQYAGAGKGFWNCLVDDIPQLSFAVTAGRSADSTYLSATRSGNWQPSRTGLGIGQPDALELSIYPTSAGTIPILIATVRNDFELLVQALSKRNEPATIPSSMGACMIAGLNNWGRVRRYRQDWASRQADGGTEENWKDEMRSVTARKELYQDRLIVLSDGPYSGVTAQEIGVADDEWRRHSLAIRWGHECAHYFTRRVLGSMRNNILDELIADYCGIRKAIGRFESSWFLRFMGLENYPRYRAGARLENYCVDPVLSAGALAILRALVHRAARNLQRFDERSITTEAGNTSPGTLLALASCTLEEMAQDDAPQALALKMGTYRSTAERNSV